MPKKLEDQLREMEDLLTANTVAPVTDQVSTDPPSTEHPVDDATDPPTTDQPADTDPPATDAAQTDPPTTDAPSEIDLLKAELEELKKKFAENATTDPPSTDAPTTEAPVEDLDFFGEEDPYDTVQDKDKFNTILNSLFKKAVETAMTQAKSADEKNIVSIPEIVSNQVKTVLSLRKASKDFYDTNKDLVPHKAKVAEVYEAVAAENPDKSISDILNDVAPKVREVLGLTKKAKGRVDPNKPKLPSQRGTKPRQNQRPDTNSLAAELAEMEKALNS